VAGDYDEWLRRHHAKFSTPSDVVDRVVARVMGRRVVGRERVLRGEVNEVYVIDLDDGDSCVVRIAHGGSTRFTDAEPMIALARSVGVPAPETVTIERLDVDDDDDEREICVQRRMPGRPLDEIQSQLPEPEIHRLVADAGELLARLHHITGPNGTGEPLLKERDEEWLAGVATTVAELDGDGAALDRALDVIDEVRSSLAPSGSVLVHSDFGTKHFMVHEGAIAGILDWDGSRFAHPIVDIEWWDMFYDGPPHPIDVLLQGYTRVAALPPDHEVLRIAYGLNHAMGLIGYYRDVENHRAAQYSVGRITSFLAKWDALTG
jgi:aminoglycoside phosphotransferase (APT) family kinase protein